MAALGYFDALRSIMRFWLGLTRRHIGLVICSEEEEELSFAIFV